MMKDMAALVREHPFMRRLDERSIRLIGGCAANVRFDPGKYIFREGDAADHFFLIRAGQVALETYVPGRGPLVFLTLQPGDILGISWLVPPYRYRYDTRAVTLTRALAFDAKCLRDKCDADPAVGYELMKRMVPALVERLEAARLQTMDVYGPASA